MTIVNTIRKLLVVIAVINAPKPKELGKNHPPQSRRTQKNERITPGAHAGPSRNLARNCSLPAPLPGRGFWGGAASRGPQKKRSPLGKLRALLRSGRLQA